jgi:hypothetical protein
MNVKNRTFDLLRPEIKLNNSLFKQGVQSKTHKNYFHVSLISRLIDASLYNYVFFFFREELIIEIQILYTLH